MITLLPLLALPLLFAATPAPLASLQVVRQHVAPDDDYIPWATTTRLTWDDFLSAPKRNTDVVASTSTALGIAYQVTNGKLTYQITCKFSKNKSWGLVKTPYILAHEQGHFDITEVFARKLHQALKNYTLNRATLQQDINTMYDTVVQAKERLQAGYDAETDHSRNKQKQAEWLQRIDQLLQETEAYAAYP